jgi:O-antigen/teichoic acid export membrane protein
VAVSRGLLLLVGSQVVGQVSLLAITPILTRAFSPGEFGVYQIALAISLIAQPVATLRLEYVIPITVDGSRVRRYFATAMRISAISSVALVVGGAVSPRFVEAAELSDTLFLTGIFLFMNSWVVSDNSRLIRNDSKGRLALRNLIGGVSAAMLQVAVALIVPSIVLVALALLAGRGLAIAATMSTSNLDSTSEGREHTPYGFREALPTIGAGVVSNASSFGLTLLSGGFFGTAVGGQVGTAQRVTNTPSSLVGQALTQYFQSTSARIIRDAETGLASAVSRFVYRTGLALIPLAVGLIVFGPVLAEPILGPGWAPAGVVVAILAVPISMQMAIAPIMPVLVMLHRENLLLALQASRLVAVVAGAAIPAAVTGSYIAMCLGYAISTSTAFAVSLVVVLRECRKFPGVGRS